MPAKNQITPTSLPSRIRDFFSANPGRYRPRDVSEALGSDYIKTATELSRMYKSGALTRFSVVPEGKVRAVSTYALPDRTETE